VLLEAQEIAGKARRTANKTLFIRATVPDSAGRETGGQEEHSVLRGYLSVGPRLTT